MRTAGLPFGEKGMAGMAEQCSDDPGRTTETKISALGGLVWLFWTLSCSLRAESSAGTCWGSTFPGFCVSCSLTLQVPWLLAAGMDLATWNLSLSALDEQPEL